MQHQQRKQSMTRSQKNVRTAVVGNLSYLFADSKKPLTPCRGRFDNRGNLLEGGRNGGETASDG